MIQDDLFPPLLILFHEAEDMAVPHTGHHRINRERHTNTPIPLGNYESPVHIIFTNQIMWNLTYK